MIRLLCLCYLQYLFVDGGSINENLDLVHWYFARKIFFPHVSEELMFSTLTCECCNTKKKLENDSKVIKADEKLIH